MKDRLFVTVGTVVILLILAKLLSAQDYPRDDTVNWTKWSKARENVAMGFGPLIDDLESYVFDDYHTRIVRNPSDPGNWVHELTHRVNAMLRDQMKIRTGVEHNSFYVFDGYAFSAPEPDVTLLQVAAEVPKADRGIDYQHYLKYASKWYKHQPMFVLNESNAYCNGMWYQISIGKPDRTCYTAMLEFLPYADAVITATEKHDSDYAELEQVRAYVIWNRKRAEHLANLHRKLVAIRLYSLH